MIRSHTYKCPHWVSGGFCKHPRRFLELYRPKANKPCPLKLMRPPIASVSGRREEDLTVPASSFLTSDPQTSSPFPPHLKFY